MSKIQAIQLAEEWRGADEEDGAYTERKVTMYTVERLVSTEYEGRRSRDVPLAVTRESAAHHAVPGMPAAWASCH